MKKILYCASTMSHIKNFHLPYLRAFHDNGYEVWVAADKIESVPYVDHVIELPFRKNIISLQNIKAINKVKALLKEQDFDIISTHTTLASAVIRAAVIFTNKRPKVFCTVHGYLFNEIRSMKKWIYLLPEKIFACVTNVLMVMNHEDYAIAEKHKLYRDKLYYINGMGINLSKFQPVTQAEKLEQRALNCFSEDNFLFVYAAEFSKRKNQSILIRAFANVCKQYPNMMLLLAGNGALLEECKSLAKELYAEKQILFLGYVEDIRKLYTVCDVCVTTSRIEGLPFNVMEARACGLPVIASNIKGHRELVEDGKTGILFRLENQTELEGALQEVFCNTKRQIEFGLNAVENIDQFQIDRVFQEIIEIYRTNM